MPIDADLVTSLIAEQFPQWSGLPVTPVAPQGWDNRSFRLGADMLVRLPSAARYAAQVAKEQRWLPMLAPALPFAIPKPIAKGRPTAAYLLAWSVYGWINGTTAKSGEIADDTTFARDLAQFLRSLHRIDTKDGPAPGAHNFHRGGALAVYDTETRAALNALQGRIDTAAASAIWDKALASHWHRPAIWLHGDIACNNLLVKDGALCAILDFGSCAVGDPACDLVAAWTMFDGEARSAFCASLPFDAATWARAQGWALWKAVITVADKSADPYVTDVALRRINDLLANHLQNNAR